MKKSIAFWAISALFMGICYVDCMAQAVQVAPRVGSQGSGLYYLYGKKGAICHQEPSAYLISGVVPEVDGKVTFTKSMDVPGKSKSDISTALAGWASLRFMSGTENGYWSDADYYKNTEYSLVKENDTNNGILICTGNEEQVFSNRTLSKDYAVFQYTLTLNYSDGQIKAEISDISYLYTLKEEPERITAEDYITDKECITKKGTLNRLFGKFRAKTVDLADELFKEIEACVK